MRRRNPDLAEDLVAFFSRTPFYVAIVAAIAVWVVCSLVFPKVAILGPVAALVVLMAVSPVGPSRGGTTGSFPTLARVVQVAKFKLTHSPRPLWLLAFKEPSPPGRVLSL